MIFTTFSSRAHCRLSSWCSLPRRLRCICRELPVGDCSCHQSSHSCTQSLARAGSLYRLHFASAGLRCFGVHADRAPVPVGQVGRAVSVLLFWARRVHLRGHFRHTCFPDLQLSVSQLAPLLFDAFFQTHQLLLVLPVPDRRNE